MDGGDLVRRKAERGLEASEVVEFGRADGLVEQRGVEGEHVLAEPDLVPCASDGVEGRGRGRAGALPLRRALTEGRLGVESEDGVGDEVLGAFGRRAQRDIGG